MKKNPNSILLAWPIALLLILAGCSKHEDKPAVTAPTPEPVAQPAAKPASPVQKPISSATGAAPQLDFRKRTDPFKAYAPIAAAPAKVEQPGRPASDLLPIQTFEVSKFKVSGIIAGLRENRALLVDPNGKGYVVQEGMLIGSNNGRITKITAASVEVLESYKEDNGRVRKRKIVLTLAKKR